MAFARHSRALGVCDRCSTVVRLQDLTYQYVEGRRTSLRVCHQCLDEDNPQWRVRELRVNDPLTLPDPRPDQPEPFVPLSLRWGDLRLEWGGFNPLGWG